jgi:hypothetical protein
MAGNCGVASLENHPGRPPADKIETFYSVLKRQKGGSSGSQQVRYLPRSIENTIENGTS